MNYFNNSPNPWQQLAVMGRSIGDSLSGAMLQMPQLRNQLAMQAQQQAQQASYQNQMLQQHAQSLDMERQRLSMENQSLQSRMAESSMRVKGEQAALGADLADRRGALALGQQSMPPMTSGYTSPLGSVTLPPVAQDPSAMNPSQRIAYSMEQSGWDPQVVQGLGASLSKAVLQHDPQQLTAAQRAMENVAIERNAIARYKAENPTGGQSSGNKFLTMGSGNNKELVLANPDAGVAVGMTPEPEVTGGRSWNPMTWLNPPPLQTNQPAPNRYQFDLSNQDVKSTTSGGYADGTVIKNKAGQRMIMRGGSWQPIN